MKKYRWSVSCFLMATFDLLIPGKIFRETTRKKINTYSSQLFFTKSLFRFKKNNCLLYVFNVVSAMLQIYNGGLIQVIDIFLIFVSKAWKEGELWYYMNNLQIFNHEYLGLFIYMYIKELISYIFSVFFYANETNLIFTEQKYPACFGFCQ